MSYALLSAPITFIDETHNEAVHSYCMENLAEFYLELDMGEFKRRYLQCINMGVEEFEHHLNSSKGNLKNLGQAQMWYLYHAMRAAIPHNQTKADAKYKEDTVKYHEYLDWIAERMREMSENPSAGDPSDPDERVRAGTHRRVKGEPEATGAGKGQKRSLEYIVPNEDGDSDEDHDGFM
jgi:hypothetical protein